MDIRHLKNYVAIVDCGSLSRAAERVYLAQSALSQQLALLESELGTQLLLRSSLGVTPTEAGKVLYRHARTLLRQMEQMREEVARPGAGEIGPVVFGLPSTMVGVLALPLYQKVRDRLPAVRLDLFEGMSGYLGELLAHGRLDVAIQFVGDAARGVNVQPLLEEDLYVVGDRCGAASGNVCPIRELDGVPMVIPLHAQGLRMVVERSFTASGVELNVVANVDSFRAMLAIARSGDACAILPLSALVPRVPGDSLAVRKLVEPGIRRAVGIAWSTSLPHTNAAAAVCRIVAELAGELVATGDWPGAVLAGRAAH
jgi:LysR family nitrogen assimilation transcriptional regulator